MSFELFNLHPNILRAVVDAGFVTPTPVQQMAIPLVMEGKDIRGSAQTGTGKSAAFILPILHRLTAAPIGRGKGPRALILAPTRELAIQLSADAKRFSRYMPKMKTVCIYGGVPYPLQRKDLAGPYDILIATPGRLIDHLDSGRIDFDRLEVLVLDEADRMLDMGFIDDVKRIAEETPEDRQTLLFSATMRGRILELSKELLVEPESVKVDQDHAKNANIEQRLHLVDDINHKHNILLHLLKDTEIQNAIVFTSTKSLADDLAEKLYDHGIDAAPLHGDMNQRQRTRTIKDLREGRVQIIVATDVAARGIDVQTITHVFNFDLPNNAEDYVHRIGRTGRAGAKGIAVSFCATRDSRILADIERYTGHQIERHVIPGLEPRSNFGARSGSGSGGRRNDKFKRNFGSRGFGADRSRSGRFGSERDESARGHSGRGGFGSERRDSERQGSGRQNFEREDSGRQDFEREGTGRVRSDKARSERSAIPGFSSERGNGEKRSSGRNDSGRFKSERSRSDKGRFGKPGFTDGKKSFSGTKSR